MANSEIIKGAIRIAVEGNREGVPSCLKNILQTLKDFSFTGSFSVAASAKAPLAGKQGALTHSNPNEL
jgi:hypothetical protein